MNQAKRHIRSGHPDGQLRTPFFPFVSAACMAVLLGIVASLAAPPPAVAAPQPSPSASSSPSPSTPGVGSPGTTTQAPAAPPSPTAEASTLAAPVPLASPVPGGTTPPAAAPAEGPNSNPLRSGIQPLSATDAAALRAEMGKGGGSMNAGKASAGGAPLSTQSANTWSPDGIQGVDVSGYQPGVNWASQFNQGARFAYVKASEGTYYTNDQFYDQYTGSRNAGMIRGAYHFATPSTSTGADQARFFVANGGGWSADGMTLPPLLDIEYNPYQTLGNTCYNMSQNQMIGWIRDFSNTMQALTGRQPVIYTTTDWWNTCTGNNAGFANQALHLARYSTDPGPLPNGWSFYSIWQYSSEGPFVGDSNVWNGTYQQLKTFAFGRPLNAGEAAISNLLDSTPLGAQVSNVICGLRAGGCYQGFENGEILWSSASGAQISRVGSIRALYRAAGAENSSFGYPTGGEQCGLKNGGCYQMYQGGAIMWSPQTGAQVSPYGAIRNLWAANSFENGVLGYPTTGENCGLKNGGCYQMYQGGAIMWSPQTGAQVSHYGPIRDLWAASGFENGALGYPTTGDSCGLKNGGCYQIFQNGQVHWSASTGAQLTKNGALQSEWAANGYESGTLGYPIAAESCQLKDGGCFQTFQNGQIHWSSATGAHLTRNGAIRTQWAAGGYENGPLGYPTSSEGCGLKNGGCAQSFQHGQIHWSPTTGARVTRDGAIRGLWLAANAENGVLGYPVSAEACGLKDGGCYQSFQNGQIHWSAKTGAQPTRTGAIANEWASNGYEAGVLGYPTSAETCGLKDGGCYQSFQGGQIHWSPASGAHLTRLGAISTYWGQSGWEKGPLGYPTGSETCKANGECSQAFQNGTLAWSPLSGVMRR
jgi:uncharacterized protein with LGFP repeats/GH25 family lysozyme M1 (1,4-beta-N-acetylmuramidase)